MIEKLNSCDITNSIHTKAARHVCIRTRVSAVKCWTVRLMVVVTGKYSDQNENQTCVSMTKAASSLLPLMSSNKHTRARTHTHTRARTHTHTHSGGNFLQVSQQSLGISKRHFTNINYFTVF